MVKEKSYNIEKIIKALITEGVIVKNKRTYQFSNEFVKCVKKVNADIKAHKKPESALFCESRESMLGYLLSEAYIDFIPAGTKFDLGGLRDKVEVMILIMSK